MGRVVSPSSETEIVAETLARGRHRAPRLTGKHIWLYCQIMAARRRLAGETKARLDARARVMKALAHPTRLFIVEELSRGERCVCDLTEKIGADVSTVSKHLSVLKGAGIVLDDKRGVQVFYRLRVPCILNFFGCVEAVLEEVGHEGDGALAA
jgi:DNA-binding transcriptional ArsR family regulator